MSGFYGKLAADAGRRTSLANDDAALSDSLLQQARAWRESVSGVNLDEEALSLVQYQRAYQASAKLITTLSEMTETLLGIIR
jgi:flagellar hook-associated protein 1 FlgK